MGKELVPHSQPEIIDAEFEDLKQKPPFSWRRFWWGWDINDWTPYQQAIWRSWPWWKKLKHRFSWWPVIGSLMVTLPALAKALADRQ